MRGRAVLHPVARCDVSIDHVGRRSHATQPRQPRQVRKEATVTGKCVCSELPASGFSFEGTAFFSAAPLTEIYSAQLLVHRPHPTLERRNSNETFVHRRAASPRYRSCFLLRRDSYTRAPRRRSRRRRCGSHHHRIQKNVARDRRTAVRRGCGHDDRQFAPRSLERIRSDLSLGIAGLIARLSYVDTFRGRANHAGYSRRPITLE